MHGYSTTRTNRITGLPTRWSYTSVLIIILLNIAIVATELFVVGDHSRASAATLTATWQDPNTTDHDGFILQRKTGTTGSYTTLTTLGPTVLSYYDSTVTAGATYCYQVAAYNAAGTSAYSNEACATVPTPTMYALTVSKTGSGTVASSPGGINCGSTCSASFANGTSVALSATPATGYKFSGWSGACTGTGTCTLILGSNQTVTATFTASVTTYALSVSKTGTGTGTVTSSPSGINCGTACSASFASGTAVTLTATAASGSTFSGWSGACTGTGTCSVTLSQAQNVTASLTANITVPTTPTSSQTAAISFVQVAAATPQAPTQRVSVAYPNAQTAGDLNVVVVGWNDTAASVSAVTDSRGNVYTLAIGPTSGTNLRQAIFYAPKILGGATTVTVAFNQPAAYPDIRILEYQGVTTLDRTAGASGTGTTASTGAVTTTAANELLVAANTVWTGNVGAGTGFTTRIITLPDSDQVEDRIVSATGTYSATAPLTVSGPWVMQLVTFK